MEQKMSTQLGFDFYEDCADIRSTVLQTAKEYVTKDRPAEYGDVEENFRTIADYWSTHLAVDVTSIDVSIMMTLLKIARLKSNSQNIDSWVDGCGYLALGAELSDEVS
jgi:hypothetical protein|tara:strand:+ start:282 stop:605 length:324 start_codon:yes stop_codon:yes gene_type:complete